MRFLFVLMTFMLLSCSKTGSDVESKPVDKPAEKYQEGVHYGVVKGQAKPSTTEKIEVMEIFWYGCGHCLVFEMVINPWEKTLAPDVNFVRSPAMWDQAKGVKSAMWTHAQVYYTAESLGVLDKVHPMFFQTIHKYKKRMVEHSEIEILMNKIGLDGKAFLSVLTSKAINDKVKQAEARLKTYKITGTPEIIVGGYYHVTSRLAGSQEQMLDVVDFLVNKIRAEG